MRKIFLVVIAAIAIVSVWIIINMIIGGTNDALNKAFNPIDYSCSVDSDCAKTGTNCNVICGSECVNKNWKLVCIFPEQKIFCTMVLDTHVSCKCIDNVCVKYNTLTNQTTN